MSQVDRLETRLKTVREILETLFVYDEKYAIKNGFTASDVVDTTQVSGITVTEVHWIMATLENLGLATSRIVPEKGKGDREVKVTRYFVSLAKLRQLDSIIHTPSEKIFS